MPSQPNTTNLGQGQLGQISIGANSFEFDRILTGAN